jgi:hypothetical protein
MATVRPMVVTAVRIRLFTGILHLLVGRDVRLRWTNRWTCAGRMIMLDRSTTFMCGAHANRETPRCAARSVTDQARAVCHVLSCGAGPEPRALRVYCCFSLVRATICLLPRSQRVNSLATPHGRAGAECHLYGAPTALGAECENSAPAVPTDGHSVMNLPRLGVRLQCRYKALIGPRLRARGFAAQQTEAAIGVAVLNRMLAVGRPESVRRQSAIS